MRQFKAGQLQTGSIYNISSSYALTASYLTGYVSPFPFTGSAIISGSLNVTGSISSTGGISGSFTGNGSGLTNIPASGITGLNLSQIAVGNVSASVSLGTGSFTITSGSSTLMFVSSSGNVGFGTSSPANTLSIKQLNSNTSIFRLDSATTVGSNTYEVGVDFYSRITGAGGTDSSPVGKIYATGGAEFRSGKLRFQTIITNGGSLTDTMTLYQGNVGIGSLNTLPSKLLQVTGLKDTVVADFSSNTVGLNEGVSIQLSANAGNYPLGVIRGIFTNYSGYSALTFSTSTLNTPTEALRITSGQNVLINTTTDAGYKLDVNGTVRIQGLLTLASGNFLQTNSNTATWFSDLNNPLRITRSITLLNLNNNGDADFSGTVSSTRFYSARNSESDTTTSYTAFLASNTTGISRNLSNYTKTVLQLTTNGGGSVQNAPLITFLNISKGNVTGYTSYRGIEVVDLDSYFGTTSGSVGIGTTNITAKLHISGASSAALLEIDSPAVNNILFVSGSGRVGINTGTPTTTLDIRGTQIATGSIATTMLISSSLSASANNDVLVGLDINSSFNTGSFTGVTNFGQRISQSTVAGNNGSQIALRATDGNPGIIGMQGGGWNAIGIWGVGRYSTTSTPDLRIFSTGNVIVNTKLLINATADAGYNLDVNGTGRFTGAVTGPDGSSLNGIFFDGGGTRRIRPSANSLDLTDTSGNIGFRVDSSLVRIGQGFSYVDFVRGLNSMSHTTGATQIMTFTLSGQFVNHLTPFADIVAAGYAPSAPSGNNTTLRMYTTNTTSGNYGNIIISHNGTSKTGNVLIGTSVDAGYTLNVSGSTNIIGNLTVTGSTQLTALTASGALINGNITVLGTASFISVTSSIVQVGASTITLNTNNPAVRFGGINVVDSGSFGTSSTGSLLWDSQNNRWIYSNPSGSTYDGGLLISGPRNTSGLGNEEGTTLNALMKGQGGDHITSSGVFEVSGSVGIGTATPSASLDIRGTQTATGSIATTMLISSSLSASANSDVLVGLDINPSFNTGSFTTTRHIGLRVQNGRVVIGSPSSDNSSYPATLLVASNTTLYSTTPASSGLWVTEANSGNFAHIGFYSNNTQTLKIGRTGTAYSGMSDKSFLHSTTDTWFTTSTSGYPDGANAALAIFQSTKNISIGTTTDAGYKLDVNGTARVNGNLTVSSTTLYMRDAAYGNSYIFLRNPNGIFFEGNATQNVGSIKFNPIAYEQYGVAINSAAGSTNPPSSAVLALNSTIAGFLPTRHNSTSAIPTASQGLMTYVTASASEGLYYYSSGSIKSWTRVLNDTGSQAIYGSLGINRTATASLDVAGTTRISGSFNTATSGSILTVIGSGSAQPIFTVQGSQGELFSITDSLSGSLFSVNDISGLPILEVFSDNTTLIGNYQDPMLITTAKVVTTSTSSFTIYSLPTASYDTAFFEYSVRSGSNARAGSIMAMQLGTSVNFTETTTTDFGSTTGLALGVFVTGSNMILTGSATTTGWTVKTIVRGL